VQQLSNYMCR